MNQRGKVLVQAHVMGLNEMHKMCRNRVSREGVVLADVAIYPSEWKCE